MDLECMAVPEKYKTLGSFHKYYSGEAKATCPTIFSKFLINKDYFLSSWYTVNASSKVEDAFFLLFVRALFKDLP